MRRATARGRSRPRGLPDSQGAAAAANGIVSRTLLRSPTARVVLFGFAEGQELTEHTSTSEALIQILSGHCDFSLNGRISRLSAGDVVHLPPNAAHAVKATERFSMLLTLLKTAEPAPGLSRVELNRLVAKS